jgi:regulator of protease activity HflC (stomatin/prohibitin superfamily)
MASVDPMQVMTVGRVEATKALESVIQSRADAGRLGIEVLRVGLIGMHPYLDVADAYEAAINAQQEKETLVLRAEGEANIKVPLAMAEEEEITGRAKAYSYSRVLIEKAKSERFHALQKGYEASPSVFVFRQYMDTLTESTKEVRKYVLALDRPERVMLIVNEEEKLPAGMLDLGQQINESLSRP